MVFPGAVDMAPLDCAWNGSSMCYLILGTATIFKFTQLRLYGSIEIVNRITSVYHLNG